MTIVFWTALGLVVYTYVGYGLILYLLVLAKRLIKGRPQPASCTYEPEVTLLVAAYNEKDYAARKVENTRQLDYPADKLKQVWITDGSDDGTPDLLRQYGDVTVLHEDARNGKIAAMNRGMQLVDTPIVVFSDANTLLGKESIRRIVNLFERPTTGCVSGEKRIRTGEAEAAAGAGEGLYWRYESTLKKWDAELYSVVGAAGELFAVRTELYQHVEPDTLLDDFIVSLRIAKRGYTIQYDPEAYAIETASANVQEELKRKIRIAAGGIQSIVRLAPLLNIFRYGMLSFQYISHRVLRWTLAPLALPVIFISNALLWNQGLLYQVLFLGQVAFYAAALLGWYLEHRKIKLKLLFVPYYFFIMNYAVYCGFGRYLARKQDVRWERAKRGDAIAGLEGTK
jgi:cellulose synthase/poly-beta-1,6-N-acetylglucosamine synthase-like glycosyltransferase